MSPRRAAELYRAPFPLYTVRLHPRRPIAITAGGGGAAKTGIRNGVVRGRDGRGGLGPAGGGRGDGVGGPGNRGRDRGAGIGAPRSRAGMGVPR